MSVFIVFRFFLLSYENILNPDKLDPLARKTKKIPVGFTTHLLVNSHLLQVLFPTPQTGIVK